MTRIVCGSPTCAATVVVPHRTVRVLIRALRRLGWSIEQQPGDDRPQPYCERCKETTGG